MKYKIFLNPGHDTTKDPGACYNGLRECDVNASVGRMLLEELVKRDYEVSIMQNDDLEKVCRMATQNQDNLFVSLHCNAFTNESVSGTEVCVYSLKSESCKCATAICEKVSSALDIPNRGLKERNDLYVLNSTPMPAVLVEMFFVSNKEDVQKFKDNMSGLIMALADGIETHFSH